MDVRDLFLDQPAAMHSAAVGGNKMSFARRAFAGLTDEQMRVRPRQDLNSLAWLMWHIARTEDIVVNVSQHHARADRARPRASRSFTNPPTLRD